MGFDPLEIELRDLQLRKLHRTGGLTPHRSPKFQSKV